MKTTGERNMSDELLDELPCSRVVAGLWEEIRKSKGE